MTKRILAIDTSCDDTAVAVATAKFPISNFQFPKVKILSNVVSSQVKLHAKYGGVWPMLAKREHQRNLVIILTKALTEAGLLEIKNPKSEARNPKQIQNSKLKMVKKILEREETLRPKLLQFLNKYQKPKVDAIAVTVGPGLEPCLWVGVNFARALALWWDLPIIPVNHLEAHLLANFIDGEKRKRSDLSYFEKNIIKAKRGQTLPAVGLVVSGGNTQLFLIKDIGKYKLLGETRDDAAGECFDKTARILGLGYPGGQAIAALAGRQLLTTSYKLQTLCRKNPAGFFLQGSARKAQKGFSRIELPRPMINSKNYDFSFSGLKTAVLYDYKKRKKAVRESAGYRAAMAREIQQAVIDVLLKKTLRAATEYQAKAIILGGGVTANAALRHQFKAQSAKRKVDFLAPEKNLCTDNAAMIAITASFHFQNQKKWGTIKPSANLIV